MLGRHGIRVVDELRMGDLRIVRCSSVLLSQSGQMKGVIFNLLESVATQRWGENAWDDILESAGVEGAYTAIGNYADEEFQLLLLNLPTEDPVDTRLRWFGRAAMPLLAKGYPEFFGYTDTYHYLRTINDVIHREVRKLYPGVDVPVFDMEPPGDLAEDGTRHVTMGYRSARRLCRLAEGFILGAADYFGEQAHVSQRECMLLGADRCVLVCTFQPGPQ